jgi:hypothetical protein
MISREPIKFLHRHRESGHHVETRIFNHGIRAVIVDKRGRTIAVLPQSFLANKEAVS